MFLITQVLGIFYGSISMAIPENITFHNYITIGFRFIKNYLVKIKQCVFFITVSVPRCSLCRWPLGQHWHWLSEQHSVSGQPTCQADALGAVAQVHHHSDLQGDRVVSTQ
jgi:hypothetical protein